MVHAVIEYCKLDMMPIEMSETYREFVLDHGEEQAKELIYEVIYPPLKDDA